MNKAETRAELIDHAFKELKMENGKLKIKKVSSKPILHCQFSTFNLYVMDN